MSPDGSRELRLVGSTRLPLDSGSFVEAELVSGQNEKVLQDWYRNDLGFSFAAAAWDGSAGSVGLMLAGEVTDPIAWTKTAEAQDVFARSRVP